ncbi:MAG: hypothetical protein Q4D98_02440 [Planctomycetia bacterium]|nr:hypothetical protein [Planctomycetia bacterium]
MSVLLNSRISAEISWNRSERGDGLSASENGSLKQQTLFSSESSPGVDRVWTVQNVSLAAEYSISYSLVELTREVLGSTETIAFSRLCGLYFCNRSPHAFLVVENRAFARCVVPPGGYFCLCNPAADWVLTSSNNRITITNSSTTEAASFDLALTGTAEA